MIEPRSILARLDLTDAESDVYLAMLGGAMAARDIVHVTGRSRPTVYYALGALERRGLLSKNGLEDEQRFRVEPLERLMTMVSEKQAQVKELSRDAKQFVQQFEGGMAGDSKPQVSFYEGVAAIRNVIMETIYCHGRQIDTLVPKENFFWQLGAEFVEKYVAERHNLGVRTRNLWGVRIEAAIIEKYYDKAEIRMMPGSLGDKFRTTIFMYDESVLYISSLASGYALLVRSAEHIQMMRAIYDVIWEASEPLSPIS